MEHIYHLAPAARWRDWPGDQPYLPAEYDTDGFVHCTAGDELMIAVANRFYRAVPGDFVLLAIDPARLTAPLKWEAPNDGLAPLFPHIYGPIDRAAVLEVRAVRRAADGEFLGMASDSDQQFQQILERAQADPYVLGMCLGGSRGKGFENEFSDYDICMIVADETPEPVRERYLRLNSTAIDLWTMTLSEFREAAAWDSPTHWNRYSYTHVTALIDKLGGEIQQLIDDKGKIPDERREPLIRGILDGYINSVYRSLKCLRKRNMLGARLEAAKSIGFLLDLLFAHEGRHRPYYGYLEGELRKYPLKYLPLSSDNLLAKIDAISASADRTTQQELLAMVDVLLRPAGFGDVFDSWGADYPWMQSYQK